MIYLSTVLLTALAFALVAVCVLSAWQAHQHASAAAAIAARWAAAMARLQAVEAGHESLLRQHNSLRAKFYKTLGPPPDLLSEVTEPVVRGVPARGEPCANWTKAQRLGPTSDEARCVCDYCEQMRAERARRKAETLPKSLTGKIDVARKGLNQ